MGTRVLWALILAPPVLLAIYLGAPWSDVLFIAAGIGMQWEWARLAGRGTLGAAGWASVLAVTLSLLVGVFATFQLAAGAAVLGGLAAWLIAGGVPLFRGRAPWLGFGVLYVATATLALMRLRNDPEGGLAIVLWLLFVVWATDSCAYFVGRSVGGPRMAPRISPNKTWSGLLGGVVGAALVGLAADLILDHGQTGSMMALSGFLAIVAQLGDLLESQLKRRFDAKDSSHLIPGHGGLLDRADGLLSASLVVAFGLEAVTHGT